VPLFYVDVIRGRGDAELQCLLDGLHAAAVEAFEIPDRDRYQVVTAHDDREVVALDTGLQITRSRDLVIIHAVSRSRPREQKQRFYDVLARNLARDCHLDPADLIVSITENGDEDWSFGLGRAQFLTGELA
jgi:phenylpyruvate tautomerase PptA (4-oxalocrotonate tautomerase family)